MVDAVVARAVAEFGGVDILVNNAGTMDRMSAAHETDDVEWERVLRIDLTAPFLLTRAVLPHMLNAGTGCLVFTGSEAGLRGGAAGAAYTAAKHGITGLVKNLAVMYREQGIRTNMIAPGPTVTGIGVDSRPEGHGPPSSGALSVRTAAVSAPPTNRLPPSSGSPPTRPPSSTARFSPSTTAGQPSDPGPAPADRAGPTVRVLERTREDRGLLGQSAQRVAELIRRAVAER